MSLQGNSSHYVLNRIFHNCEALTVFLYILFLINIERLKFSFRLRIFQLSIVNATFCHDNEDFLQVYWEIPVYNISWI